MSAETKILMISGLSGGKNIALQSLEDIGYYCIGNLPLALLTKGVRKMGDNVVRNMVCRGVDYINTLLIF